MNEKVKAVFIAESKIHLASIVSDRNDLWEFRGDDAKPAFLMKDV